MPRQPREIKPDYCYHITTRCNNREFQLSRRECREVFLYAIKKAFDKFNFKLYAHIPPYGKGERLSPGQMPLPGWQYQVSKINNEQVSKVAEPFILANRGVCEWLKN